MTCIIDGGIMQFTGEFDVGKTSMALECGYRPEEIIFVDDDVKGQATVKKLMAKGMQFAKYIDFTAMTFDKSNWMVYQKTIEVLEQIKDIVKKDANIKVLIWDTWTRSGDSFIEYVRKNPQNFVVPDHKGNFWKGTASMINGLQYKHAALHEASILNELQKNVPLIFLITHIKNNYVNNVIAGVKAASSKTLNRIPYFRLWLRRNPDSPIPIGLVMKRISDKIYNEEASALRTVNILPPKIVPNIVLPEEGDVTHNDLSLWDTIARYYKHPAGLRKLLPTEIPNEEENAILSGTMTKEQRISWTVAIKQQKLIDIENSLLLEQEIKTKAMELKEQGKLAYEIARELKIDIEKVINWTA